MKLDYKVLGVIFLVALIGFTSGAVFYSTFFSPNSQINPSIGSNSCEVVCNTTEGTVGKYNQTRQSFTRLFQEVKDSTVSIEVEKGTGGFGGSQGSGWVYSSDGYIITNHHVIEGATEIKVHFLEGTILEAEVVGTDPYSDLAVLKVEPDRELDPLPVGDSKKLKVGDRIAAVGNPYGLSGSMTTGIVSQKGRLLSGVGGFSIANVIQIDAAVNPGNSGGPLLNTQGKVVGVNTAIQSSTGSFTGIGFAIPSITVERVANTIIKNGEYRHPWIGVEGRDVNPEIREEMDLNVSRGFLIINVKNGSPADRAGLIGGDMVVKIDGREVRLGGDVILEIDDKKVRSINDILVYLESSTEVGDTVEFTVLRDGEKKEISLTLSERPEVQN